MPATGQIKPLHADQTWRWTEATLVGEQSEAVFAPFARHTDAADFVVVNRQHGEPVIMLSNASWKRVLASLAVARGDQYPSIAGD